MLARVLLSFAMILVMGAGSAGRASCTMHGMGSIASHAGRANTSGDATHHMVHHGQSPAHDQHSDGCCCGGECAGVAQVARMPEAATVRVAVVVAEPANVFEPRQQQAPPAEPDRLLPFSNGPPVVAAV